jgi:hypothetical protein
LETIPCARAEFCTHISPNLAKRKTLFPHSTK